MSIAKLMLVKFDAIQKLPSQSSTVCPWSQQEMRTSGAELMQEEHVGARMSIAKLMLVKFDAIQKLPSQSPTVCPLSHS